MVAVPSLIFYYSVVGGEYMGTVSIGKQRFEVRNVILRGGMISLDDRVIYLCNNLTPIQVKGDECYIISMYSGGEVIVSGGVESALSRRNVVVWGRVDRASTGGTRFYNYTASDVFRESKSRLSKKNSLGKRLLVKLSGEFSSLRVEPGNFCVEILISGQVERLRCDKDIIIKGKVSGSRSEGNTYISRLK